MAHDPFTLFCFYYLGLNPDWKYRFSNGNQIAARLNYTVDQMMGELKKHGIHPDTVLHTSFPMARHQVDIQIAASEEPPEQVQARARAIYEEFRSKLGKKRDWLKEIEEEKEADRKPRTH